MTCKSMMSFLAIVYIDTKSKDTEKYKKYAKNDMQTLNRFKLQNHITNHAIAIYFCRFKKSKYPLQKSQNG